jgi:hypothetical protein
LDSGFWILNSVFLRSAALLPAATQPANDIMDLIHAELLATGARIAPLTTLDEIAAFFHAAAAVGQAAPARATAIAQRLGGSLADAASMFASILPTLPSMPNVERLLSMLPPCESMSIGPNRDTCAGMPLLKIAELAVLQGLGDGLQNWTKSMPKAEYEALTGA